MLVFQQRRFIFHRLRIFHILAMFPALIIPIEEIHVIDLLFRLIYDYLVLSMIVIIEEIVVCDLLVRRWRDRLLVRRCGRLFCRRWRRFLVSHGHGRLSICLLSLVSTIGMSLRSRYRTRWDRA